MDRLFDIDSAALKLGGVSSWTVRSWLSRGLLERTKIGRRTMVSERALDAFVLKSNIAPARNKAAKKK